MATLGAGQICHWDGGSLWIGNTTGTNAVHAHHAVQIALALAGTLRFQSPDDGVWIDCAGAVIGSNHPHAFDGRQAATLAHVFVEPESPAGRVLEQRFRRATGIAVLDGPLLDAAVGTLAAAYGAGRRAVDLVAAARRIIELLTDGVEAARPVDPRILRALDYVHEHLGEAVSLSQVAGAVHLSPGRLRHLFVAEMGLSFRRYVLWLRLKQAVEAFADGESLTAAAYRAGFADSAHLSRTFRRMYGIAAASLALSHSR